MKARRAPPWLPFVAVLALLLLPARSPAEEAASFLIVNPGGPGSQGLASGFLADFAAALAASWPSDVPAARFEGRYRVTESDALASMRSRTPDLAILSPGFYLDHRDAAPMRVALVPARPEGVEPVLRLVRVQGAVGPLTRVGGPPAAEPRWLAAVMPELAAARAIPAARTLEALRDLRSGKVDAVLLHDADWRRARDSGRAAGLVVVATSRPVAEGPVVTTSPVGEAAARAMAAFPSTASGRKVLERMGLEGFKPMGQDEYDRLCPSPTAPAPSPPGAP